MVLFLRRRRARRRRIKRTRTRYLLALHLVAESPTDENKALLAKWRRAYVRAIR